ncbi:MAG: hypothetical protein M3308_02775 [Actinomycetota bacterium]|nr:hypothetical protein [Actinomycetota bacterium]
MAIADHPVSRAPARADSAGVASTLRQVAQIGPYFALDVPVADVPAAVPLAHLYAPGGIVSARRDGRGPRASATHR